MNAAMFKSRIWLGSTKRNMSLKSFIDLVT